MLSRAAAGDPGNTVEWVQIDPVWRKLPFESGTFDAVVAASVLEYVERPRIALRECARVLRPGGIVLCTVPDPAHPVRWLEWAAGLAVRLPLPGLARPGPLPTRLPLGRAAGGRWPRLRGYVTYLRISRHRRGAGWWRAVAAQSGLLTPASPASGAGHSPLRLLMFTRPASTGENS
jgi:SAM-dependent methyltransferase